MDKLKKLIKDAGDLDFWIVSNKAGVSIHKGLMGDSDFSEAHPKITYDVMGETLEEAIESAWQQIQEAR